MIDNNERILTGSRLKIYKRNRKIFLFLLAISLFAFLVKNRTSYYRELEILIVTVASLWFTYLFLNKQTTHQLKKKELAKGRRESKKILQSLIKK